MPFLTDIACAILLTGDPWEKARLTLDAARTEWSGIGAAMPPDRPARPESPILLPPNKMPKRSYGGVQGRIGLLHALAHIELNAIDLAWDIIARFTHEALPDQFFADWVKVAVDEARHFLLLDDRLRALGSYYGALPAHDGLWQAAEKTAHSLPARLTIVPMTLEARGLDTTPPTIDKLRRNNDEATVAVLQVIFTDEIDHVAIGCRWFAECCDRAKIDPAVEYARLVERHFPARLKPPFNDEARAQAGFPKEWYEAAARSFQ